MFGCFVLIIFKVSHPLWPVLWLDSGNVVELLAVE